MEVVPIMFKHYPTSTSKDPTQKARETEHVHIYKNILFFHNSQYLLTLNQAVCFALHVLSPCDKHNF